MSHAREIARQVRNRRREKNFSPVVGVGKQFKRAQISRIDCKSTRAKDEGIPDE
jgi:hypothetical protein